MVVPPFHTPKMIILVGKPMVVGYHHFRKPPFENLLFPGGPHVHIPRMRWISKSWVPNRGDDRCGSQLFHSFLKLKALRVSMLTMEGEVQYPEPFEYEFVLLELPKNISAFPKLWPKKFQTHWRLFVVSSGAGWSLFRRWIQKISFAEGGLNLDLKWACELMILFSGIFGCPKNGEISIVKIGVWPSR